MTELTFTQDNLPSPTEFRELLKQAEMRSSIMDELLRLLRQLVAFERKYDLASDVFYARFMRGEMGDELDFIRWAGRYELYLEAKQEVDSKLAASNVA
ncbi:MAG: hypothetical protein ACE5H9_11410 [Anaerolineae bacterium]